MENGSIDRSNVWAQIENKFLNSGGNNYTCALKTFNKINDPKYKKILCSVSGGADSDIMIDWIYAMDFDKKVIYVFFDTGLEYVATKRHLDDIENKYGIEIKRVKSIKSIPACCKEYGIPFLDKNTSSKIKELQKHNFQWEDEPFNVLIKRYCRTVINPKNLSRCYSLDGKYYVGCVSALRWWCGEKNACESENLFSIKGKAFLKEFMIENPPDFKISDACCSWAKKMPSAKEIKDGQYDLKVLGLRKSEGGIRATIHKNCFTRNYDKNYDDFRPLFFILDTDKESYKINNEVVYSDCYEIWGFKRTGCAGCPINSKFDKELEIVKQYEPNFYTACQNIFGKSYEYRRKYNEFRVKHSLKT